MYDYDKILKESLERLFSEDFDKIGEEKELKFGHTLLNIPKMEPETKKVKNNGIVFSKTIKEFVGFSLAIVFFIVLFLGAFPTISSDIFSKEKAQVSKVLKIEYICDVISQGELKTTGNGICKVKDNKVLTKSSFNNITDSVNYMLIITNTGNDDMVIKKYKSINKSEQIYTTYKMFYNNKELISDDKIEKENVTLKSKESVIVIINQKYNSEFALDSKEFEYNINMEF